jgi:hypothetical protein
MFEEPFTTPGHLAGVKSFVRSLSSGVSHISRAASWRGVESRWKERLLRIVDEGEWVGIREDRRDGVKDEREEVGALGTMERLLEAIAEEVDGGGLGGEDA